MANQIRSITSSNNVYAWPGPYAADRTYTVNGLNQVTSVGGVAHGHDVRGNLNADGVTTYGYDVANRLTSAGSTTYAYDALDRLYQIVGSANTRFAYDGAEVIAEYDAGGSIVHRYVRGPGVDETLVWYVGSGTTQRRWLTTDHAGSITAVTDASGAAVQVNSYDEFGNPAASNLGRFQYTGQMWLAEAGLYHYKARAYSPALGRFMQTDPIGYADGMNLYAYVANDPINRRDPSGMASICTVPLGSFIESCVHVDGDGDGNAMEKDLTRTQIAQLGNDFSQFIVANKGKNIAAFGKDVITPNNSSIRQADVNMVRVVSQFVGAAAYGAGGPIADQWRQVRAIVAAERGETRGMAAAQLSTNNYIFFTGIWSPELFKGYGAPSDLARLMFHETGHVGQPGGIIGFFYEAFNHRRIDDEARFLLKRFGLAGGGCVAASGFPSC